MLIWRILLTIQLEVSEDSRRRLTPDPEIVSGGPTCSGGVSAPDFAVATFSSVAEEYLMQSPLIADIEPDEEIEVYVPSECTHPAWRTVTQVAPVARIRVTFSFETKRGMQRRHHMEWN